MESYQGCVDGEKNVRRSVFFTSHSDLGFAIYGYMIFLIGDLLNKVLHVMLLQ